MKDQTHIANEAFVNFIRSHPELNVAGLQEGLTRLFMDEKRIYSRLAVDFTVQFVLEQFQLEQVVKKSKKNAQTD